MKYLLTSTIGNLVCPMMLHFRLSPVRKRIQTGLSSDTPGRAHQDFLVFLLIPVPHTRPMSLPSYTKTDNRQHSNVNPIFTICPQSDLAADTQTFPSLYLI